MGTLKLVFAFWFGVPLASTQRIPLKGPLLARHPPGAASLGAGRAGPEDEDAAFDAGGSSPLSQKSSDQNPIDWLHQVGFPPTPPTNKEPDKGGPVRPFSFGKPCQVSC